LYSERRLACEDHLCERHCLQKTDDAWNPEVKQSEYDQGGEAERRMVYGKETWNDQIPHVDRYLWMQKET
jgi:hypothetical protein